MLNTIIYLALLAFSVHHFFWFRDTLGYSPEVSASLALLSHIASVMIWRLFLTSLPLIFGGLLRLLLVLGAAAVIGFVLVILTGHTHLLIDAMT